MPLTNEHYVDQYKQIHSQRVYGVLSMQFKLPVLLCILELRPKVILDYGCGQSPLHAEIKLNDEYQVFRYDPAIPEISTLPVQHADLLLNTDVLEHIPERDIDDVLSKMRSISENAFFNISTRPAKLLLPSGENAHCTVKEADWWLNKVKAHFPNSQLVCVRRKSCLILTWKPFSAELFRKVTERSRKEKRPALQRLGRELKRNLKKLQNTAKSIGRSSPT